MAYIVERKKFDGTTRFLVCYRATRKAASAQPAHSKRRAAH